MKDRIPAKTFYTIHTQLSLSNSLCTITFCMHSLWIAGCINMSKGNYRVGGSENCGKSSFH